MLYLYIYEHLHFIFALCAVKTVMIFAVSSLLPSSAQVETCWYKKTLYFIRMSFKVLYFILNMPLTKEEHIKVILLPCGVIWHYFIFMLLSFCYNISYLSRFLGHPIVHKQVLVGFFFLKYFTKTTICKHFHLVDKVTLALWLLPFLKPSQ